MIETPQVSIVIPTFNRADYLRRGLSALRAVDYSPLQIVVVDGQSTDHTQGVIEEFRDIVSVSVSEPDKGEYDAINKGILATKSEIVKLLTDDDVLQKDGIRIGVDYMLKNPDVDILFAQCNVWRSENGKTFFDSTTNYIDESALDPKRYFITSPGPPSLGSFIRRRTFEKIGMFATDFVIGDYEFWARAVVHGIRIGLIPDVVVDYHLTGENTVVKREKEIRNDMVRIAQRYGDEEAVAYALRIQRKGDNHQRLRKLAHRIGFHPYRWLAKFKKPS